jgi:hypothetical protein
MGSAVGKLLAGHWVCCDGKVTELLEAAVLIQWEGVVILMTVVIRRS